MNLSKVLPPSAEFAAERPARLAELVELGVLTADDVASMGLRPTGFVPVYVSRLRKIGVTVLDIRERSAVIRCPHCGGRRNVSDGYQSSFWLSKGRVPACNSYGNVTCVADPGVKTEAGQ